MRPVRDGSRVNRRQLLRGTGGLLAAPLLAGCTSEDGDGRASESPTRSARATAGEPEPSDATGTARSTVPGLTVGDASPFVAEPLFVVEATVTNTGGRETKALFYEYDFALTTGDGTEPEDDGVEVAGDGAEIAPGEPARLTVREEVDGDPAAVTEYDLTVTCTENSRGVYCGN
jgi:hypothetical protein